MPPISDAHAAVALSAKLCCAGVLLQSLELAPLWRELRDKHLLGWQGPGEANEFFPRAWRRLHGFPVNLAIVIGRAAAAAICLVLPIGESVPSWFSLCALFATQFYFNRCFQLFFANSDHVTLVCLAALAVGAMPWASDTLRGVSLAFLAFQACLGYCASGLDKLSGANWRDGSRLVAIFRDSSHRVPVLGLWLGRHPRGAQLLSWSVILLEVLFPLCLVTNSAGFWVFIAAALMFHAGIAVLMGLPGFFWAFAASYPALYFVREWIARVMQP